jgi:hypothetical protein
MRYIRLKADLFGKVVKMMTSDNDLNMIFQDYYYRANGSVHG